MNASTSIPRFSGAHEFISDRTGRFCDLVDRQLIAPQGYLAADVGVLHRRQIDRDHIHRDAPDQTGFHAIDNNGGSLRSHTGISVGIATGDDTDFHRAGCGEYTAVANGIALFDVLDLDDFTGQGHDRFQAVFFRCLATRCATVKHDTGTNPVGAQLWME